MYGVLRILLGIATIQFQRNMAQSRVKVPQVSRYLTLWWQHLGDEPRLQHPNKTCGELQPLPQQKPSSWCNVVHLPTTRCSCRTHPPIPVPGSGPRPINSTVFLLPAPLHLSPSSPTQYHCAIYLDCRYCRLAILDIRYSIYKFKDPSRHRKSGTARWRVAISRRTSLLSNRAIKYSGASFQLIGLQHKKPGSHFAIHPGKVQAK